MFVTIQKLFSSCINSTYGKFDLRICSELESVVFNSYETNFYHDRFEFFLSFCVLIASVNRHDTIATLIIFSYSPVYHDNYGLLISCLSFLGSCINKFMTLYL